MAGLLGPRTWRADDGHQAQPGVARVQRLPIQAQFAQGAGPKRGQQHIGLGQQAVQRLLAGFGFEVNPGNAHPLVHGVVSAAVVQAHGIPRCALGRTGVGRRLELDAARTHGPHTHQCRRSGQVQRQTEHAHAAQRPDRSRFGRRALRRGGVRIHHETGWFLLPRCVAACYQVLGLRQCAIHPRTGRYAYGSNNARQFAG